MHAPAVVAITILVVTLTAQWCVLTLCPPRRRVSVLCEAKVAESARDEATVYAGAVECFHVAGSQDLQVVLALALALTFAFALAVALAFAFARWFFALAIVLAAVPQVQTTARGHGQRVRAHSKPQEGQLRAMKRIHKSDELYVDVSVFAFEWEP